MEISNHGQIAQLFLPADWVEGRAYRPGFLAYLRSFHPYDNDRVQLRLWYRGLPVRAEAATNFNHKLSEPDHKLDTAEIESLTEILSFFSNATLYRILQAKTETIGGRRVLIADVDSLADSTRVCAIFLADPEHPACIQEIQFWAPKAEFEAQMSFLKASISSIKWT